MIALMIVAGILGYVFLGRIYKNLMFDGNYRRIFKKKYVHKGDQIFEAIFFPISVTVILCIIIANFPIKLADFVTNPSNYKFSIKLERK